VPDTQLAYIADFNGTKLGGALKFYPGAQEGVRVEVGLKNVPATDGPFSYHVHDQPVPTNGNCTLTLAHLDPFIRGQKVICDPKRPESCEVGDLSGKHGKILNNTISNGSYNANYYDKYITLLPGVGSFIGNRSVVVHLGNGTRYACANIIEFSEANDQSPGNKYGPGYWGCGLGVAVGLRFLLV